MKTLTVVGALGVVAGVMVAAGGCAAAASPGAVPAASAAPSPAAAYLAIARTGNARLDKDFDRFNGPDRNHLTASAADLRDIAATEHVFDQHLAQLTLRAPAAAWAHTLIRANEARATLTLRAADSTTLRQLDSLRPSLTATNAPVERAVSAIRATLGLPPPGTS